MMLARALRTCAVATAGTTATLLVLGKRHAHTPWAPIDAVSHIAWGDRAFACDKLDVEHTLVGAVLNAGAVLSWSALHALLLGQRPHVLRALASGAAVSALAYLVDYHVVPRRLMPGFEVHLRGRGLRTVYVVLALSLAAGGLLAHARE
jgi:hypothetical protein